MGGKEMKRRIVVLTMLCILLTSCAPTYAEESSAVSEDQSVISEQSQDDSVLDDMTFPDRYHEVLLDQYKGKNAEQLEAEFDYSVQINCRNYRFAQNATSVYFKSDIIYRYDKLTGKTTALCPDPLCEHNDSCIFGSATEFYLTPTKIFYLHYTPVGFGVYEFYVSDLDGTNLKLIKKLSAYSFLCMCSSGEVLFLRESKIDDDGRYLMAFYRLDAEGELKRLTEYSDRIDNLYIHGEYAFVHNRNGFFRFVGDQLVPYYSKVLHNVYLYDGYIYGTETFDRDKEQTDWIRIPFDGGEAEKTTKPLYGTLYDGKVYNERPGDEATLITVVDANTMETVKTFSFAELGQPTDKLSAELIDGNYLFTPYADGYDFRKAEKLAYRTHGVKIIRPHLAIINLTTGEKHIIVPEG